MVDPWGFIKNVLDAHGAWILGGAIVANLAHHTVNKKSKGFKRAAEWDYVKCIGCGRGGYSDEMRSGSDASGKNHFSCARCSRPDLFKQAEGTDPCQHCDGTAAFPREFYYQADRIEMVPCGTCITQGRCPGCMEIYPNLSRDNTPEDVFLGSGCTRCGYTEADARAARKTARRWADLVDNPAAAKFMAEGDFDEEDMVHCNHCSEIVGNEQEVYGDETVDYEVANGELVCVTCYKIWMKEYKNDLDPHYTPFYAEDDAPKVSHKASIQSFIDYEEQRTSNSPCDCHVCVDREPDDETKCYVCDYKYPFKTMVMFHGIEGVEAKCKDCFTNAQTVTRHCPSCGGLSCGQQYGLPPYEFHMDKDGIYTTGTPYFLPISYTEDCEGWCESMSAESYDPDTHGKTLPLGSVKRFLTTIPRGQMFHVEFVKSNGDIRPMDAFFNKPYQPDSNTANVMEVTGSGKASFKRFRVDHVVSIYRI